MLWTTSCDDRLGHKTSLWITDLLSNGIIGQGTILPTHHTRIKSHLGCPSVEFKFAEIREIILFFLLVELIDKHPATYQFTCIAYPIHCVLHELLKQIGSQSHFVSKLHTVQTLSIKFLSRH